MSEQKLYLVELTFTGIVMAESEGEALQYASDIKELEPDMEHVATLGALLPGTWKPADIIFHAGGNDLTVTQARELVTKQ
jgi:hypothetical protein